MGSLGFSVLLYNKKNSKVKKRTKENVILLSSICFSCMSKMHKCSFNENSIKLCLSPDKIFENKTMVQIIGKKTRYDMYFCVIFEGSFHVTVRLFILLILIIAFVDVSTAFFFYDILIN